MLKKLFALTLILTLSGCALLGQPVAEKVAKAVDTYCEEPYQARQLYRRTVNGELAAAGHSVVITCAGDPRVTEE